MSELRVLIVHDTDIAKPEVIERQIRAALEPQGYSIEIAADTNDAIERLKQGDVGLLVVDFPRLTHCSDAIRSLLSQIRDDPARKDLLILQLSRTGGDQIVDPGYWIRNADIIHPWTQTNELLLYIRRLRERQ